MNGFIGLASLVAALSLLGACENKSKPSDTPAPSAPSAPVAAVADEQLSTPADFDEQAAKEIDSDNAEQELAKIEKEIAE
jgi:hypothetical protein